jgi:hypothetical protein
MLFSKIEPDARFECKSGIASLRARQLQHDVLARPLSIAIACPHSSLDSIYITIYILAIVG